MRRGRPQIFTLTLSDTERAALTAMAASRTLPYSHVRRAQIILASAGGDSNTVIAERFDLAVQTVGYWRGRFHAHRLAGLSDAPRSGRPRTHDDDRVAELLRTVLTSKPTEGTHWSVRRVAGETGIAKSTVQRYFALFGVQPHRTTSFTLSTDPLFVEKVRDIAGLYLNPPDHALVLCIDEKSQIQALERTQPMLPMGLGYVEGVTHGYVRHGTTTLFAASAMLSAEMIGSPESLRIFLPRSSLVPFMRTTRGTESFTSRAAATMPLAMVSHFMMPPKMLTRIALTLGFFSMILKASVTFSGVAPPPTSRKLAGLPP